MRIRKKIPRKEWTTFDEVIDLQEKLNLNDTDFMMISGCASSTFYLWRRKGKVPANNLAAIRLEMIEYFRAEFDKKCKLILGK